MPLPKFAFDRTSPAAGNYLNLDTGQHLTSKKLVAVAQKGVQARERRFVELTKQVTNNEISVGEWQAQMRDGIKRGFIEQYMMGRGGRAQMSQSDWGRVGAKIREQFNFLSMFEIDLANGVCVGGRAVNRARMYASATHGAFSLGMRQVAKVVGWEYVRWVLAPDGESCIDCINFSSMGWQLLDSDPYSGAMPGDTIDPPVCGSNCRCHLEYSRHEVGWVP